MRQSKFILFIFFDIPQRTKGEQKSYRKIITYMKNTGFYSLQESVYIKSMTEKHKAERHITTIKTFASPNCHIRSLTLTYQNFMAMKTIMGEDGFGESLIKKQKSVIVI